MKVGSVLTCLVGSAVLLSAAATDPKVTFIPHDKVAQGGTLVAAPDLTVLISHRASRGEADWCVPIDSAVPGVRTCMHIYRPGRSVHHESRFRG